MFKWKLLIGMLCFSLVGYAQSTWVKQDLSGLELQKQLISDSLKPGIISSPIIPELNIDSLSGKWFQTKLGRLLFQDHLIKASNDDFAVFLDPAMNFQIMRGKGMDGYINTRGFHINGHLKHRIYFTSTFFENQGKFPEYLNTYAEKYAVLPGYSRMKVYNETAWDYASALGSVHLIANDHLSFRLGHDKLFIGSGHRSLFLSDAAFQQFFLQTNFSIGKFQFTNLSMQWMNPNFNNFMETGEMLSLEGNYPRKFTSIHILQYAPNDKWNISLIEGLVFHTEGNHSPFSVHMINPFILSRSLMTGFYGKDNLTLGADVRYQNNNHLLYAQFLLDEFSFSDTHVAMEIHKPLYAYQIGAVFWDVFVSNFNFRIEHNYVNAFCYSHENPEVSWTHYNQNPAHPLGSNFAEFLVQFQYRHKRIPMQLQVNYFIHGDDELYSESLAPQPIYLDYESSYIVGNTEQIIYADFETGFYLNPAWRSLLFAGITYRQATETELWLRFGLRTNLNRQIRDF